MHDCIDRLVDAVLDEAVARLVQLGHTARSNRVDFPDDDIAQTGALMHVYRRHRSRLERHLIATHQPTHIGIEIDFELDEDVVREALEEQDWTYGFEINDVEPSYYDRQLSITTSVAATKTFDVEVDYSPGEDDFEDAVREAVLDEVGADLGLEVDDIAILNTEAL